MSVVRPDETSPLETPPPPNENVIDELLNALKTTQQKGGNGRASQRYSISMPVSVVPIDQNGQPVERPFTAMSRDISTSGICLLHTRATNAKQLIIVLSFAETKRAKLTVEVVRCRAIGRFYEIAAKFTGRDAQNSNGV